MPLLMLMIQRDSRRQDLPRHLLFLPFLKKDLLPAALVVAIAFLRVMMMMTKKMNHHGSRDHRSLLCSRIGIAPVGLGSAGPASKFAKTQTPSHTRVSANSTLADH